MSAVSAQRAVRCMLRSCAAARHSVPDVRAAADAATSCAAQAAGLPVQGVHTSAFAWQPASTPNLRPLPALLPAASAACAGQAASSHHSSACSQHSMLSALSTHSMLPLLRSIHCTGVAAAAGSHRPVCSMPCWHTTHTAHGMHSMHSMYAAACSRPAAAALQAPWQSQQLRRAHAKMAQQGFMPPAGAPQGKMMQINANALLSPNVIAEPYKGEPPRLPLSAWFTPSGWRARSKRWLGAIKSMYTLAKCKKHVKGFTLPKFKDAAAATYAEVCAALAAGDLTALRQLVTPAEFTNFKRELKAREAAGWGAVAWRMAAAPTLRDMEVVHGRLVQLNPKDDKTGFAQLTVRLRSRQAFAAYADRKRTRRVAGDLAKEVAVEDVWVFEHGLRGGPAARWRLAARLSLPPSRDAAAATAAPSEAASSAAGAATSAAPGKRKEDVGERAWPATSVPTRGHPAGGPRAAKKQLRA